MSSKRQPTMFDFLAALCYRLDGEQLKLKPGKAPPKAGPERHGKLALKELTADDLWYWHPYDRIAKDEAKVLVAWAQANPDQALSSMIATDALPDTKTATAIAKMLLGYREQHPPTTRKHTIWIDAPVGETVEVVVEHVVMVNCFDSPYGDGQSKVYEMRDTLTGALVEWTTTTVLDEKSTHHLRGKLKAHKVDWNLRRVNVLTRCRTVKS